MAFQALFSYDIGRQSLEELLSFEWTEGEAEENNYDANDDDNDNGIDGNSNNIDSEEENFDLGFDDELTEVSAAFARLLIAGTIKHLDEVDTLINRHLNSKWRFDRINRVSLAILRISVYSLLYQRETPPTIVINEAIDLAKGFGTWESFKFVNAVLDNIHKELQT